MRSSRNFVIANIDKYLEDVVKYKSMELAIDPLYKPTWNARIYGEAVSTNEDDKFFLNDPENPEKKTWLTSDVKNGDKIYFHYLVTHDPRYSVSDKVVACPYEWIFCYVRDGRIEATAGWVLGEILYDEGGETVDVNGHKIKCSLKNNIVTSIGKKERTDIAKVFRASSFKGEESGLSEGDIVAIDKGCNFKNEIEGTNYFLFREENVIGVL
jgi:co-chaperonin GroES (HSP10)